MDEKQMELAENLTARLNASGIEARSKLAIPSTDLEPDQYKVLDCERCDEPLPEFRCQKGLVLCTPCQEAKERAQRRF